MIRNLLFRSGCGSPVKLLQKECVRLLEASRVLDASRRPLAASAALFKKRKSIEERAVENQGRRVLRYSPKAGSEVVGIWKDMTVTDIAQVLNKDIEHVFKALQFADKTGEARYQADTVVRSHQLVRDVVKICGARFRVVAPPERAPAEDECKDAVPQPAAAEGELAPRPPVVCVMGHVDHGKTTLLDALRGTRVAALESGGITQHIGAFQVKLEGGAEVTFLDTPGHAAFSAMRARGAGGADLVVLVVAADDGVMEQTLESVRMAREAGVPILVAVNKIDKPGVNIDRTLRALATHGVVCEALGGEVQAVAVSALRRAGLPDLVEALAAQAALAGLRAARTGPVEGAVLEAGLRRAGKQATVLVRRGTLRRGAVLVAGAGWGKVRAMLDSEGRELREAPPGTPAAVLGWKELPAAGDAVLEVPTEKRANEVMRWRHGQRMREKQEADAGAISAKEQEHRAQYRAALERRRALGRFRLRPEGPRAKMLQEDSHPHLTLVVKGDVDGSLEAILDILATYEQHEAVRLDVAHAGVGPLAPGDLEIAEAFKATVYLFNVECEAALAAEARGRGVELRAHDVIYRLVADVRRQLSERMPPRTAEEILGEANVLAEFLVWEGRRRVPVAGARCVRGELRRAARYRLLRAGEVLYDGELASMKHLKQEVTSIKREQECGLRLRDPDVALRPGDTLQCYTVVTLPAETSWDPGFSC